MNLNLHLGNEGTSFKSNGGSKENGVSSLVSQEALQD
jgi:hypothetical protein